MDYDSFGLTVLIIYLIFLVILMIPGFIMARKKGYTSFSWLILVPIVGWAFIAYYVGMPDKEIKKMAEKFNSMN